MYYQIKNYDRKEWMLCIHCMGASKSIFAFQIRELSKRYNFILLDLPGHGKSKPDTLFTLESLSRDMITILEQENIDKVTLLSLSIGCAIAFDFSCRYPERVTKSIYLGGATEFSLKSLKYAFHLFMKVKRWIPKKFYLYVITKMIVPLPKDRNRWKMLYEYCVTMNMSCLYRWLELSDETMLYLRQDYLEKLKKQDIPKLFISGKRDYVFLKSLYRDISCLENTRLYVIEKCGHLCNLENPKQVNQIILQDDRKEGNKK